MTPRTATAATACLYCGGSIGSSSSVVKGLCEVCVASVIGRSRLVRPTEKLPSVPLRAQSPSKRLNEALAQAVAAGPPAAASGKVAELLTTEVRDASLMAFVPLLGSWLVLQSTEFTPLEKRLLVWLSAALTGMLVAGIVLYAPTTTNATILRERIRSEATRLDRTVEDFRALHGRSPDADEFRESLDEAHLSIFDPWGRPYLYQPGQLDVTFGSLGRDGLPGGSDEDADVTVTFPSVVPPSPSP
jgi:hypothetical protein